MILTVQIEKNLPTAAGVDVKESGQVIGKVTSYDKVTGIATIEIRDDVSDEIKEKLSKYPLVNPPA